MPITFGHVTHPPFTDRLIPNAQTSAWDDLDFDTTGETYAVRIVDIGEEIPKPADGARWGESILAPTLVDV